MHPYIKLLSKAKFIGVSSAFIKTLLIMTIVPTPIFAQADRKSPAVKIAKKRSTQSEAAKFQRLVTDYWEDYLADNPGFATYIGDSRFDHKLYDISEKAYRRRYSTARSFLKRTNEIREKRLSRQDRISLKMLRRILSSAIEGEPLYSYHEENYLMPINQMEGFHVRLLTLPETHPFASLRDYRNYIERLRAFPFLVDAAIENMRKGIGLGIVLPKAVVERMIPQLESGITFDAKKSPLYAPVERFPQTVSAAERQQLTADLESEITTTVSKGFGKLLEFMKTEYLPKARSNFAFSDLPGGREMYAYAIKVRTTTNLSADEIHNLALSELEKITLERQKLINEAGFKGTASEFNQQMQANKALRWFDAPSVERDLRENLQFIEARLPQLFSDIPQVKYELKPVEAFRAASFPNGAYYGPSADGTRPGIFYYNTFNVETEGVRKFMLPNLAFHEVNPGHHFAAVYGRGNRDLPAFRRFGGNSAYSEGWATYAETLADEIGAYRDAYSRNFWLNAQISNYASIVAETGIHTKGWTREQAYAFIRQYLPMPESRFDLFLARWSVIPAQAIGYSAGAQRISRLRERAQKELGNRFDIRDFHDAVLSSGNVPLDVLSDLVEEWISLKKSQNRN